MITSALLLSIVAGGSTIDGILASPTLKGALTGVCVTDMSGKVLYEHLGDTRLVPASNQKILVAAYALSILGPDFRPRTRFWKEPNVLYVDAPGDPAIKREQLIALRGRFGLNGDAAIYVRQAYAPGVPPSWEWDDLPNRYAPRVTAFSCDRGGFEVWASNGSPVPLDDAYRITVRHVADAPERTNAYFPDKRVVIVRGELGKSERMLEAFAVPDPDAVAARFLGGTIVHTQTVPDREPDFVLEGPPLSEALKFCLERSDNAFAENLFLMAASKNAPLGEKAYKVAAERMAKFLVEKTGAEEWSILPIDGSGMSRHNMVTPRAVCAILSWANGQNWRDTFLDGLADPGEGTLASRLASSKFRGKTGTLNAVVCLSGYVQTRSGRRLAVSMLFNSTNAPAAQIRTIQDRIITVVEREEF